MKVSNTFDNILESLGYRRCKDAEKEDDKLNKSREECISEFRDNMNKYGNFGSTIDPTGGAGNNGCRFYDSDIINGFQDIDPMLLLVLSEIIGNIFSGVMPINVANSFGNWVQLIGQTMQVYIAQQEYQQGGPGRLYNPVYRNVANPFCDNNGGSITSAKDAKRKKKSSKSVSRNKRDKIKNNDYTVADLKREINELKLEIDKLKNK